MVQYHLLLKKISNTLYLNLNLYFKILHQFRILKRLQHDAHLIQVQLDFNYFLVLIQLHLLRFPPFHFHLPPLTQIIHLHLILDQLLLDLQFLMSSIHLVKNYLKHYSHFQKLIGLILTRLYFRLGTPPNSYLHFSILILKIIFRASNLNWIYCLLQSFLDY
jgi:hypothetical protein